MAWLVLLLALVGSGVSWETHEHIQVGDTHNATVPLPNGNLLSFGELVALAGDLYGLASSPISDGNGAAAQKQLFLQALDTLANATDAPDGLDPGYNSSGLKYQSLMLLDGPMRSVDEALARAAAAGKEPSSAYSDLGSPDLTARWNVMTGGGSVVSDYVPFGRYIELAEVNWDHFSFDGRAWDAYGAGHELAMEAMVEAHDLVIKNASDDQVLLAKNTAYAREGFAQHFLTDMFSSGHIRTARKVFHEQCEPSETGDYISRYQHDEECHYGLNVTNLRGDLWIAYGDQRLLDPENAENMVRVEAAVLASVGEVEACLGSGVVGYNRSEWAAYELVPIAVESESLSAMFKWDGKMLWRRKDLNNLRETEYIEHGDLTGWYSASTLAALELLYGPPSNLPPRVGAIYGPKRF
eukprot:TRINITY_DN19200_c0_g1_i2.p1 TRINITY_DN19200_c0_g1~~TRINITY_DN19200_c0_g1_i2.p1  ORF type:complete len:411 (+),score=81.66 TRINITY_DN19200_c0_g1_i2:177-1409(+)